MMRALFVGALALITLAVGAMPAQAQRRDLGVPATSGWKHAETGVILRRAIAGLQRQELYDNGDRELDVAANFFDEVNVVTIYVFRPALQSVPIWFDRAETMILTRDTYGRAAPLGPAAAFARPGATALSGLRRIYTPSRGDFKSTGLAAMPLGDWLVVVRISSREIEPQGLDAKLDAVIAGIGWPAGVAESPVAVAVLPCDRPLQYARGARMRAPSFADSLLAGVPATASEAAASPPPSLYCRDGAPTTTYAVYRDPAATNAYVMALGDAGRTLAVAPAPSFSEGDPGYQMRFGALDSTLVYPAFDKLPQPSAAFAALDRARPIARILANGNTEVFVDPNAH